MSKSKKRLNINELQYGQEFFNDEEKFILLDRCDKDSIDFYCLYENEKGKWIKVTMHGELSITVNITTFSDLPVNSFGKFKVDNEYYFIKLSEKTYSYLRFNEGTNSNRQFAINSKIHTLNEEQIQEEVIPINVYVGEDNE